MGTVVNGIQNMVVGALSGSAHGTDTDIIIDLSTRNYTLKIGSIWWGYNPYNVPLNDADAAYTPFGHMFVIRGFDTGSYNDQFTNFLVSPPPIVAGTSKEVVALDMVKGYGGRSLVFPDTDPLMIPPNTKALAAVAAPDFVTAEAYISILSFLLVKTTIIPEGAPTFFGRPVNY